MASSSRATPMKSHTTEERTGSNHRDRDSKAKGSSTRSKHRKNESNRKRRSRIEDSEREGESRLHQKESAERARYRSISRHSHREHYPVAKEYRDYHREHEIPRPEAHFERDYYRDRYYDYHSSSYDERHPRRYYEEETRPYRHPENDPYRSRVHPDDYYSHRYRTDYRPPSLEPDRRPQESQYSDQNFSRREPAPSPDRHSRQESKFELPGEEVQKRASIPSPSSDAEVESNIGEKVSKSSRRSEKQRSRTLKHLQARRAANDFLRTLSVSPDREKSDESGKEDSPKARQSTSKKSASPSRPHSSNASTREANPSEMNSGNHTPRRGPGPIDTRQPYPPHPSQYGTPNHSHHGSPQSASPYGRGGWGGGYYSHQQYPMNAYSPHRQNSYPGSAHPDSHYYQNAQYHGAPSQQGYYNSSYQNGHPYANPDRRYSGSQTSPLNPNNPQGNAQLHQSQASRDSQPHPANKTSTTDDDNPFRPPKNLRAEDEGPTSVIDKESSHESSSNQNTTGVSKVSFAFKAKPHNPVAKSVPDLAQKMKEPKKDNVMDNTNTKAPSNAPTAPAAVINAPPRDAPSAPRDAFRDPRERDHARQPPREPYRDPYGRTREERYYDAYERERHERAYEERYRDDRYYERGYPADPREYYESVRDYRRDPRDYREEKPGDRRHAEYPRRREDEKPPRNKQDHGRKHDSKPEVMIVKKKMTRVLPRPTLSEEHAQSNSVYYRKPGNESVIGAGTYGKVFKAVHVYTKEEVALKKIRMEGERDGFPVTAVREVKLLQSLHHPNVVRLLEVMVENNDCYMVFEYASHDLTGLLNHPNFVLTAAHKKHLIKQLFDGLDYLHRRGVLHRDIKAANILVTNKGELKLADFGLARFYKKHKVQDYTNRVITIWYRPPELLLGETQYGAAVDVWSAACVMMEVFTKHAIFPGDGGEINQLEKVYNMLGTPTLEDWPGMKELAWFDFLRPIVKKPSMFAEKFRERLTPQAFELMQSLFVYDPKQRPTAENVLMHPYFTTEEPAPAQAIELLELKGDWHEFESKALRRKKEQRDRDAKMKHAQEEQHKRKVAALEGNTETGPEPKKTRPSTKNDVD